MPAAYVQIKEAAAIAAGGTIVLASSVTVGNRIVLMLRWDYNACPPSVTDNLGNSYTTHRSGTNYWVFSAPVTTGGSCTMTVAAGCSQGQGVAWELSGIDATPYDGANKSTNAANDVVTGSITTTANGVMVLAMFQGGVGSPTYTPGAGFTEVFDGGSGIQAQYQVQAVAGAINPSATASNNAADVVGFVAAFKAAAASTFFRPYYITG